MPSRLDKIDEFIVETIFEDNGAVKGFQILENQQKKVIANNGRLEKTNQRVSKSFDKVKTSGFELGRALRFIGGYLGVKALLNYADTWTQIKSQLALITESDKERLSIQEQLYKIAQKTRQEMPATVDLFTKLTNNAKNLNLSEEKRLELTDLINKALVAGGGTSEENRRVLLQFGQALGIGKFAGQDLKAITQGNQGFAKTIAQGLGVDIGQLPEMGQKGQLTSQKVINAILKQSNQINKSFSKIAPTFKDSMTQISNSFGRLVNKLNEVTGAVNKIAYGMDKITKIIDFLAEHARGLANIFGGILFFKFTKFMKALAGSNIVIGYLADSLKYFVRGSMTRFSLSIGKAMATLTGMEKLVRIGFIPAIKMLGAVAWKAMLPFLKFQLILYLLEEIWKFFKGENNIFVTIAAWSAYAGEKVGEFVGDCVYWLVNKLPEKIGKAWDVIKQGFIDMLNSIKDTLAGWYNKLPSFIKNMFGGDIATPEIKTPKVPAPMTMIPSQNMTANQNVNIVINEATQGKQAYINALDSALKQTNTGNGFTPIPRDLGYTPMRG